MGDGHHLHPNGAVYLTVVLDWFRRRLLSWRLSITMEAAFCVQTLEDALARYGKPEIFNTDQGSQFTGVAFTAMALKSAWTARATGTATCSSNGCGAASNMREIYLRAYDSVSEARAWKASAIFIISR